MDINSIISLFIKVSAKSGIELTKSKAIAVLIGFLITLLILLSSLIGKDVSKELAEEKRVITDIKTNIENIEDSLEVMGPPNKDEIINNVRKGLEDEQDNDSGVF